MLDGRAWSAASVGTEVVLALVLGHAAGVWLDHQLGWHPFGTLALTPAGVGAAVKALVRVAREYRRHCDEVGDDVDRGGPG